MYKLNFICLQILNEVMPDGVIRFPLRILDYKNILITKGTQNMHPPPPLEKARKSYCCLV